MLGQLYLKNVMSKMFGAGEALTRMHWECKTTLQISVFVSQWYQAIMTVIQMDYKQRV